MQRLQSGSILSPGADLKKFLKKKCKDELGVVDAKLGSLIKEELGIQVTSG